MPALSKLVAAQLDKAAYPNNAVPDGWVAQLPYSTGPNSLTVFVNNTTHQAVIAFKGSDNLSNFQSDLTDSGASAWQDIKNSAISALDYIRSNYSGYDIATTGHSLGGGMAQTMAIEYGLNGFGVNSLPIAQSVIANEIATNGKSYDDAKSGWLASGHSFQDVYVQGDPARLFYSTLGGQTYLDTAPQQLASPYAACEETGAGIAAGGLVPVGAAMTAYCAFKAHSVSTAIDLLPAGQSANSGDTAAVDAFMSASSTSIVNSFRSASFSGSDSSITVKASDGSNISLSLSANAAASDSYLITENGQANQTYNVVTGSGTSFTQNNGTLDLLPNLDTNIYGSNATVLAGSGSTVGLFGGGFNFQGVPGVHLFVSGTNGTFDTINLSGDGSNTAAADGSAGGVFLDDNTQVNLVGGANFTATGKGDSLGAYGGGNTINTGPGNLVAIANTGTNLDIVNSNGDATGGMTSNNQGTGIMFNPTAASYVNGTNNGIVLASNDTVSVFGGGNTVNSNAPNAVFLSSTNRAFDTVYANNTESSQGGAGIFLDTNTQANVSGSKDYVAEKAGDSAGVYGGSNNADAAPNSILVIGNTSTAADNIRANGCTTGGTAANGQPSGVNVGDNSYATIEMASQADPGTVLEGNGNHVTISAGNITTLANGTADLNQNNSYNDQTYVYGNGDRTVNYGSGDTTYSYGNQSQTDNYGSNEKSYDYGSNEAVYDANSSDTAYQSGSSDTTSGASFGGYYGYYGFAGKNSTIEKAVGTDIGTIAQYDLSHGDAAAAAVAEAAKKQVQAVVSSGAKIALTGSQWDSGTVTYSLADHGSQFSGFMDKSSDVDVEKAFAQWSEATGLKFEEVADSSNADIRIGWGDFDTANTGVAGFTTYKSQNGHTQAGAIIRIEDGTKGKLSQNNGGDKIFEGTDASLMQVLSHEIGHALGFADNADMASIESFSLGSGNTKLSQNDKALSNSLYSTITGTGAYYAPGVERLIQALGSFGSPLQPSGGGFFANSSLPIMPHVSVL